MNLHLRLGRPVLSMLAALALLGSSSFASFPVNGGGDVGEEDQGGDSKTKRCADEYDNLDLQMDVLEAVQELLNGCHAERSEAQSQLAELAQQRDNLLSYLSDLAAEAASARQGVQECSDTFQPQMDEAAVVFRGETDLTEAEFDAMVLSCFGWNASTGRPKPSGFDPIGCMLALFGGESASETLMAAARAYASAQNALAECSGVFEAHLDYISREQAGAAEDLGEILLAMGQFQVPDCGGLESAHAAAMREVERSRARLEECLDRT